MRSERWRRARLGDYVDVLTGFPFKSAKYCPRDSGVRLLRGDNVIQKATRWDNAKYWPALEATQHSASSLLRDDVVLAMDRPWIEAGLKVAAIRDADLPSLLVQRVARIRATSALDQGFLKWLLYSENFAAYLLSVQTGTAVPHISKRQITDYEFELPPLEVQRGIAGVLGALDDLIDTNQGLTDDLLSLGVALVEREAVDSPRCPVGELVVSIARGVTPQYSDDPDAVMVLNQKCIRDQRVSVSPARMMLPKSVKPEKIADPGDTLVNSTGVGTLGRVARWIGSEAVHVDSHVSVVKANPDVCQSAVLAYLLLSQQAAIEALAEGSTGQTELSRHRLAGLEIPLLNLEAQAALAIALDPLDTLRRELDREQQELRRARDELLPLLLSGRVLPGEVLV